MWLSLGFDVLAKGMVSIPSHITRSFSSANRSFLRELLVSFYFYCFYYLYFIIVIMLQLLSGLQLKI